MLPGVGKARRKLLLDHFGSYDSIKQATIEDLTAVRGIPKNLAQSIYNSLHGIETPGSPVETAQVEQASEQEPQID